MNYDKMNEDKKSSIKCNQAPGGKGNFSFNWGNDPLPKRIRTQSRSNSKSNYNIITGEALKNQAVKNEEKENSNRNINNITVIHKGSSILPSDNDINKKISIKTDYESGKNTFNLFNAPTPTTQEKSSSIKVNHAPGGKTNFNFGNDTTSYNEYRRK
jgi:hypothetical protein